MCLHRHRGNFYPAKVPQGNISFEKDNLTILHSSAISTLYKILAESCFQKKLRKLNYQFILSGQNSWAHYKVLFFCPFLLFCKKEFFWQTEYPVYIHKEVWSMKSGSVLKMKRYAFRMGICQTWMVLKAFENVFLICGWIWAFILSTTFLFVAFEICVAEGKNPRVNGYKQIIVQRDF